MNKRSVKLLKKAISGNINKMFLDKLCEKLGKQKVLNGEIDIYRGAKRIWKTMNHKEKKLWRKQLG